MFRNSIKRNPLEKTHKRFARINQTALGCKFYRSLRKWIKTTNFIFFGVKCTLLNQLIFFWFNSKCISSYTIVFSANFVQENLQKTMYYLNRKKISSINSFLYKHVRIIKTISYISPYPKFNANQCNSSPSLLWRFIWSSVWRVISKKG